MSQHHDDENASDTRGGPILMNAVVTWFRVYRVPFDYEVANVLCTAAIALYSEGLGERQITDRLIETYDGPMATRATAPSSAAFH
jgi:hypothetical protein